MRKYVNLKVPNNDGAQAYKVTVGEVPVDGFWSISVYNARGYFEKNAQGAYSVNNITAQKSSDGRVTRVRGMRWESAELPPDHARMECDAAAL